MEIVIKFFEGQVHKAVEAGIYGIYLSKKDKTQLLYIGESSSVIVRASQHLLDLRNDSNYLGLTDKTIDDSFLTLSFELLEQENDSNRRQQREKDLIKKYHPLFQKGNSDKAISREKRVKEVNGFLEEDTIL